MPDKNTISDTLRELRRSLTTDHEAFRNASITDSNAKQICLAIRENLKRERIGLHIDQGELAQTLDLSQSAISKFETGRGDVGVKMMSRFADGLGLVPLVIFVSKNGLKAARERPQALFDIIGAAHDQMSTQMATLQL